MGIESRARRTGALGSSAAQPVSGPGAGPLSRAGEGARRGSRGRVPEQPGAADGLGWPQIVRLGLVQTALGSVVVLMTATL
ncbi:MAG: MFS transporter, partial [Actinomycetospora chiangmaiensis]|nr:MFS transporter [Actinomycetospora chiangmaiensis]